jgi:lysosomal Pro-X carboxypeptidase
MFWPQPFDEKEAIEACVEEWGVKPRPMWASIE